MDRFWNDYKSDFFLPAYIFYGGESFLIDEAVNALKGRYCAEGDMGLDVFEGEADPRDIVLCASTGTFFGGRRMVLIKDAPWLIPSGKKKGAPEETMDESSGTSDDNSADTDILVRYLGNPNPDAVLVFRCSRPPDKRRKIIKSLEARGRICEFPEKKGAALSDWIQGVFRGFDKKAPAGIVDQLIFTCGSNLYYLNNEIGKLITYIGDNQTISLSDYQAVAAAGDTANIFDLLDLVSFGKADAALALYSRMADEGLAPQMVLALLARQLHHMLVALNMQKQGISFKQIMSVVGVRFPFIVEKMLKSASFLGARRIMLAMKILLDADIANKTGRDNMLLSFKTTLLEICSLPA